MQKSKRWSLCIDPELQANKFIRRREADSKLFCTKLTNVNFGRDLENAIRFGKPLLIENIGETLDPLLDPVLQKNIVKKAGS
jgi:dynein heavy chain